MIKDSEIAVFFGLILFKLEVDIMEKQFNLSQPTRRGSIWRFSGSSGYIVGAHSHPVG